MTLIASILLGALVSIAANFVFYSMNPFEGSYFWIVVTYAGAWIAATLIVQRALKTYRRRLSPKGPSATTNSLT